MATAIAARAPEPGAEPPKLCKCGCDAAIAPNRVFVNRDHQVTWLRAEGAKRRRRSPEGAPQPASPPEEAVESSDAAAPVAFTAPPEPAFPPAPVVATPFQTSHDMRPIAVTRLRPGPRKAEMAIEHVQRVEATPDIDTPAVDSPTDTPVETLAEPEEPVLSIVGQLYTVGFIISALPAFCLTWLYCFAAYGTAGAALGWLPALVVSGVTGATWPGLAMGVLGVALTQIV